MARKKKDKRSGITRRDFFKYTAAAGATGTLVDWTLVGPSVAQAQVASTVLSSCQYCSVDCGLKISVDGAGNVVDIYGDEDHVISRGALCSKGSASIQLVNNPNRIGVPGGTRPPGCNTDGPWKKTGDTWSDISWDTALTEIANAFAPYSKNYTPGGDPTQIGLAGGTPCNNEEGYLFRKVFSLMGCNSTDNSARI
ncbi:MAG: twin-arginine translocation signal domain-containing protein [Actinomycetota bacterium]|nr:twin-arginine translocation signal domain-containing protein [Actinomycetota bacterium]